MLIRSAIRSIKYSLGRYLAIVTIVMLGVGFFAGLRVTKPSMIDSAADYFGKCNMYDFQLISNLGWDKKTLNLILKNDRVLDAEGSITHDIILTCADQSDVPIRAISMPVKLNMLHLTEGRLPQKANECVVDADSVIKNRLGNYLNLSYSNKKSDRDKFRYRRYKIVGIVNSPLFPVEFDRGTTKIGNGSLGGFIYIPDEGFDNQARTFSSIYLSLKTTRHENNNALFKKTVKAYSDEYNDAVDDAAPSIKHTAKMAAKDRRERLINKAVDNAIAKAQEKAENSVLSAAGLNSNQAKANPQLSAILISARETAIKRTQSIAQDRAKYEIPASRIYVSNRNENTGYSSFETNSNIVKSVSLIFPLFFFLVAALVCMTSMTRMMEVERSQIGVLKALGYSNYRVLGKYIFYSGSAGCIGSILGFLIGCRLFPHVIWNAYKMMYNISGDASFIFDSSLFFICLAVTLMCTVGTTLFTALNDFTIAPAQLIRPRAPKSGKRILIERVKPIWNRFSFLHKVSMRNIFRYKKRFILMILGISGCTALLITGFGIDTTIKGIGEYQYNDIFKFDYTLAFENDMSNASQQDFLKFASNESKTGNDIIFLHQNEVKFRNSNHERRIQLIAADENSIHKISQSGNKMVSGISNKHFHDFIDLHYGDKRVSFPKKGEAVVCRKMHERYGVNVGDTIKIREGNNNIKLQVSGICDNYVFSYIFISSSTYKNITGVEGKNTALVLLPKTNGINDIRQDATSLSSHQDVAGFNITADTLNRIDKMMQSLNAVVFLVTICAAILAFIVLYNLTTINITERIREIATIKVLGFTGKETAAYVLRENFMLTGISALFGIPLGIALLKFVIDKIDVDAVFFVARLAPMDYIFSVVLTFVFTILISIFMIPKLNKISMIESLKSVE